MAKSSKPAAKKHKKKKQGPLGSISADRRRRIYIAYRIPMIAEELDHLAREAETLVGKLNDRELPQESPERLKDMERLIFLTEYRPVLKKELQNLRGKKDRLRS